MASALIFCAGGAFFQVFAPFDVAASFSVRLSCCLTSRPHSWHLLEHQVGQDSLPLGEELAHQVRRLACLGPLSGAVHRGGDCIRSRTHCTDPAADSRRGGSARSDDRTWRGANARGHHRAASCRRHSSSRGNVAARAHRIRAKLMQRLREIVFVPLCGVLEPLLGAVDEVVPAAFLLRLGLVIGWAQVRAGLGHDAAHTVAGVTRLPVMVGLDLGLVRRLARAAEGIAHIGARPDLISSTRGPNCAAT